MIWRIMEIEEGVILWGRRPKAELENTIGDRHIFQLIQKLNPIIVFLFFLNQLKYIAVSD